MAETGEPAYVLTVRARITADDPVTAFAALHPLAIDLVELLKTHGVTVDHMVAEPQVPAFDAHVASLLGRR